MDKPAIDGLLRNAVENGKLPGVVAAAATRDGPVYEGAFGVRDVRTGMAMTPDTVLWIASMTKAVTSVAALQLVEQGKLELEAPIGAILPEIAEPQVLEGFDAGGTPRLRPAARPITLKHLLTHTAGYAYDFWNPDLDRYIAQTGAPRIISCQNAALRLPLMSDPGTRWEYGINIDWAGKAVEAVSGKKLGQYFAENIFGPLGMNDTAFFISPDMRARLARIHTREAEQLAAGDTEIPQQPEFEMGGGGLYSTARDYLRFVRMLLGGGTLDGARILSPEMAARAMQNHMAPLQVTMLKTTMPAYSLDAEFFPGLKKSWGLIGMINDEPSPTGRSAGAIAWAGLANTFWWVDPGRGLAAVIGTQLLPFGDPAAVAMLDNYEKALH